MVGAAPREEEEGRKGEGEEGVAAASGRGRRISAKGWGVRGG